MIAHPQVGTAVWRYHAERNLPAVALRPCTIYGRHDRQFLQTLTRLLRRRVLPLPAGGRRIFDLVHISDVVNAVLATIITSTAIGRAYNLTDGERHTYHDMIGAYGQIAGYEPAILPIPGFVFRMALGVVARWWYNGHRQGGAVNRISFLNMLDMDLHYSIEAARHNLGYVPQVSLKEGLLRALA